MQDEQKKFQEKLSELLSYARDHENKVTMKEVRDFFEDFALDEQKVTFVCEYLVSNATTKDLEAAWLAHYNNDLFPDEPAKQNTLQKQAEDFLRNALAHMDPETRVVEQQYVKGYVGVNGSGKTIRAEVKVEEQVSGNTYLIAAYTKEQMKEEISSVIFGRMSKVGFAVLEYDGLYYWAYALVLD